MDPLLQRLCKALEPQYEFVRYIGRGAMGTVYLFHEVAADRPVAVKVLPGDLAESEKGKARFRREARVAANLRHPNIVPIYTFGETSDLLYYVMQCVEGESLAERLDREGPLPPNKVSQLMSAMAGALSHAHGQGVVHRDIKPENILIEGRSGRPMLTDFGIARWVHATPLRAGDTLTTRRHGLRLTGTGVAIGSPVYMAPEQADGSRDVDFRADIYALGATAYEALTGELPFWADTLDELIDKKFGGKPVPVRKLRPDAPRRLASVIEKCLHPAPRRRWGSAERIEQELRRDGRQAGDGGGARRVGAARFLLGALVVHLVIVGGLLALVRALFETAVSADLARAVLLGGLPVTLLIAWSWARARGR